MRPQGRLTQRRSDSAPPVSAVPNWPVVALISLLIFLAFGPTLQAQETSVGLGTADDFAVLSGETITNTGPTTITGDVGLHPGSDTPGFDSVTLNGELHVADAVAEQAKVDLVTAYDDAAGRPVTATIATELGGETLTSGVYDSASGTFEITGTLTLDAEGDPDAAFIFQMDSTLVTASASSVSVINGAQACNVFWQVGSSATLGTTSSFVGTVMALTSIGMDTGAIAEGRMLARNGEVTLDSNTITRAVCTAAAPDTTTTTAAPEATTTTVAPATTTTDSGDSPVTTPAPPTGGVDTGGGSTSSAPDMTLLIGFSLLAVGVGAFGVRRRLKNRRTG